MLRACLLTIALLLAQTPAFADENALPAAGDTLVIVVRHAEKASDDPRDPSLSAAGQARALQLAQALADAGIDIIFTTQYKRTRLTAEPLAMQSKVAVSVRTVDATNAATYADDLARDLRALPAGQSVLVVGHSNTVPDIVKALTGVVIEAIADAEFDRVYVVSLPREGKARMASFRY